MAGKTTVSVNWDSTKILVDVDKAMGAGLKAAGLHARKAMKADLSGPAGSPPGGPPGKVSGNLRKAVASKTFRKKGRYVGVEVGVLRPSSYDTKAAGKSFPGRMHAQAVRLAVGFVGKDRRGRIYSQPGRPFATVVLKREKQRMATLLRDGAEGYMPKPKERR